MIWWTAGAWMSLVVLLSLFILAANGERWMWLHTHWPIHKQRQARAVLCVEASKHWQDPYISGRFLDEAFRLCEDCGCPVDMWPAAVLKLYAGSWV